MQKYFGDIPAGPPVPRQQPWTAPRTESTRDAMDDHVAQTRIYREWNVPWLGDADEELLELAAAVLGGGKTSRLYERLVYKDKIADDVSIDVQSFALASMFQLQVDVKTRRRPGESRGCDRRGMGALSQGRPDRRRTGAREGIDARIVHPPAGARQRQGVDPCRGTGLSRRSRRVQDRFRAPGRGDARERAGDREQMDRDKATTR